MTNYSEKEMGEGSIFTKDKSLYRKAEYEIGSNK